MVTDIYFGSGRRPQTIYMQHPAARNLYLAQRDIQYFLLAERDRKSLKLLIQERFRVNLCEPRQQCSCISNSKVGAVVAFTDYQA